MNDMYRDISAPSMASCGPTGTRISNAGCVVSLVDRLVHNAEVLAIEGESYRLKEAQERAEQRARQRRKAKS